MSVEVGQVWKDCDKRITGRFVLVRELKVMGERTFAICSRCFADGSDAEKRTTRINIERMKPGATGYELVKYRG